MQAYQLSIQRFIFLGYNSGLDLIHLNIGQLFKKIPCSSVRFHSDHFPLSYSLGLLKL